MSEASWASFEPLPDEPFIPPRTEARGRRAQPPPVGLVPPARAGGVPVLEDESIVTYMQLVNTLDRRPRSPAHLVDALLRGIAGPYPLLRVVHVDAGLATRLGIDVHTLRQKRGVPETTMAKRVLILPDTPVYRLIGRVYVAAPRDQVDAVWRFFSGRVKRGVSVDTTTPEVTEFMTEVRAASRTANPALDLGEVNAAIQFIYRRHACTVRAASRLDLDLVT